MVISVDALTQTETRQSTSLKIHDILILEIKKGNMPMFSFSLYDKLFVCFYCDKTNGSYVGQN